MLNTRNNLARKRRVRPMGSPTNASAVRSANRARNNGFAVAQGGRHPLTHAQENTHLYSYESSIKESFDAIVPALKQISAIQHETDFEALDFLLNPCLMLSLERSTECLPSLYFPTLFSISSLTGS